MSAPVIVTARSGNDKTGKVAATYASQATCPSSCVFRNNGCYAETGTTALHTRRLNASEEISPVVIAEAEASAIRQLKGNRPLRVHVVGDCATPEAARIVSQAMVDYPSPSWTYTHAWRDVAAADWNGANVLASCESTEGVKEARARGFATALVVAEFPDGPRTFEKDGVRILPCPEQTRGVKCVDCLMCTRTDKLRERNITIGFTAHGARKNTVINQLKEVSNAKTTDPARVRPEGRHLRDVRPVRRRRLVH